VLAVSAIRVMVTIGIVAGVLWALWIIWWIILVLLRQGDIRQGLSDVLEVLSVHEEAEEETKHSQTEAPKSLIRAFVPLTWLSSEAPKPPKFA
jgi:hypothetical protein